MKALYTSFRKSRWFPLVVGILSVIFGILALLNPRAEMENIALYLGIALLVYGAVRILSGVFTKDNRKLRIINLIFGIIIVVLAILVFANLKLIGKYLPTLIGFVLIVSALLKVFASFVAMKNGEKRWWLRLVFALCVLILGFVFLLVPGIVGQAFGILMGISLIINGVSDFISFVQFKD